jgi:hypothetical protein
MVWGTVKSLGRSGENLAKAAGSTVKIFWQTEIVEDERFVATPVEVADENLAEADDEVKGSDIKVLIHGWASN